MTEIKARPTLYKGIQMRSRLEADYAANLDRKGFVWEYEPTTFGGPDGQWLPDFRMPYADPHPNTYIEVKPISMLAMQDCEGYQERVRRIDDVLRRMAVTWLSEPQATLILDFWPYGGEWPAAQIIGHAGGPWTCDGNFPFAVLWPGMGQSQSSRPDESDLMGEPV